MWATACEPCHRNYAAAQATWRLQVANHPDGGCRFVGRRSRRLRAAAVSVRAVPESAAAVRDGGEEFHGGRLIARRLRAHGISRLFTLSGGHLFSIYDGCREEGIEIVDVRHEQTAAFAAEGWAKVTRELGVCAVTAGPGVTNAISAIASAQQNN